ncbi:MAG: T9SS type A sorting domain-containing protein [Ignavibacteria bacterium]|nr:T9SS type A sorting domain-containing protein [Ignavibacteria bacterium]
MLNKSLLLSIVIIFALNAQNEFTDILREESVYLSAPDNYKGKKSFIREWNFNEERAYPFYEIPTEAYQRAWDQKMEIRRNTSVRSDLVWTSIGPTPGSYPNYGNISSRMVTGAYHPNNPDIIYIGAANGGVWKSIDAGLTWFPLTDNKPSLSMGAIVIDPVNPNIIYAGTGEATYSGASYYGRGLLKSTDDGNTWTHITQGLPTSSYFSRIRIRPGNGEQLLAALGNGGLYRSSDAGITWGLLAIGRCDDVIFTPSGDTAFAVGSGVGLIRSINGGTSFTSFGSTGLPTATRTHFDISQSNPSILFASVHSSSIGVQVYKSTTSGMNWIRQATTQNFDGGQAWYDLYCVINPKNPDIVFVGTIDVYRTTNGGTSWSNITNGYSGGNVHVDQHNLLFHPTDINSVISLNDGGIWRSTNNGTSFENLNTNLTLTQFYRIAASPFDYKRVLGGTQDNGTQQTYSSLNWAAAFGGDGGEVCFYPFSSSIILGETQNGGLRRTTNGGTSWVSATSGITTTESVAWVAPIINDPSTLNTFYTARQRLYKTTTSGSSWVAVSGNINGTTAVRNLSVSLVDPKVIFATSGSQIFRSIDGGLNFVNVTSGTANRTITSVYTHPDSVNIAFVTFSGFGAGKIYKTTNSGTTWISISSNLPDSPVNDFLIIPEESNNYHFAATDIGLFYTTDGGKSWTETENGLPNTVMMHIDYSPAQQLVRIGTHGRGVFESFIGSFVPVEFISFSVEVNEPVISLKWETASETNNQGYEVERSFNLSDWASVSFIKGNGTTTALSSYNYTDHSLNNYRGTVSYRLKQIDYDGTKNYSKEKSIEVDFTPKQYALHQNYPNPFNPSTNISYSLGEVSEVKLSIINTLGEVIETIVNSVQDKGTHIINWNSKKNTSGIFFYRLEAKSLTTNLVYNATKKMIVLK